MPAAPRPPEPAPTAAFEVIEVAEPTVACDGGGALGHPRVFLTLVDGKVVCPYCSRTYVLTSAPGRRTGA